MADISEWSTVEAENTHIDELTLSGESGQYINKIMCAVKKKADNVDGSISDITTAVGGIDDIIDEAKESGQIGDAKLKGTDLNALIDSGVFSCDGSTANKPEGYGQALVLIFKRATTNATRKIVQVCFDLSLSGIAWRVGACLQGDDTSITWSAWMDIYKAA